MTHLICNNLNNIDAKDFFNDFQSNFHNQKFCIETNANFCKSIIIRFDIAQLPHILGMEKLNLFDSYANRTIGSVRNEKITFKEIKKDSNFGSIKTRFIHYDFLEQVFYTAYKPEFVSITNMPNKRIGNTDLLFFRILNDKEMVCIGIIKDNNGYYVPTTLHVRNIPNDFQRQHRIRIIKKYWLN